MLLILREYIKRNKEVLLYYIILLLVLLSWTNKDLVAPPMLFRIVYLVCFFIPMLFNLELAPSIIILFYNIRIFSVAPFNYLPSQTSFWLFVVLCLFVIVNKRGLVLRSRNVFIYIFVLYVLFINITTVFYVVDLSSEFMMKVITFILFTHLIYSKVQYYLCVISQILVSVILSLYSFIFRSEFSSNVSTATEILDVERVMWTDPNYIGSIIALGASMLFYYFYKQKQSYCKIIFFALFGVIVSCLGLLASRGAFTQLMIPILFLIFISFSFKKIKLLFFYIPVICLFILYTDYLAPVILRLADSESIKTGSSRTIYWSNSFSCFEQLPILKQLFGNGANTTYSFVGKSIGQSIASPHNNFLEILYDYGYIGLVLFILMFFSWSRYYANSHFVICVVIGLGISFMTLCPLMYLSFWFVLAVIDRYFIVKC